MDRSTSPFPYLSTVSSFFSSSSFFFFLSQSDQHHHQNPKAPSQALHQHHNHHKHHNAFPIHWSPSTLHHKHHNHQNPETPIHITDPHAAAAMVMVMNTSPIDPQATIQSIHKQQSSLSKRWRRNPVNPGDGNAIQLILNCCVCGWLLILCLWECVSQRKKEDDEGENVLVCRWRRERKKGAKLEIIKILNARTTVTVHICMVTVALVHLCTILHPLMWVFFCSKCVKSITLIVFSSHFLSQIFSQNSISRV